MRAAVDTWPLAASHHTERHAVAHGDPARRQGAAPNIIPAGRGAERHTARTSRKSAGQQNVPRPPSTPVSSGAPKTCLRRRPLPGRLTALTLRRIE
ncbi:hypothetical protein COLSTE_00939 [Collinsella stercoris DSM 13279]|uniref:Uncharacterized protein n=1 Tax=Collinsella stercoris DSM 13279 TaxID=445975 RepID=B6GA44_9ACTN|nr:hypothetical protein COLSTE_00939 [Collinsella stercoris DSM 13279]